MKDTPWFRHDMTAGDDEKIIAMRADYGWAGYGWYWRIVEYLRGEEGYAIPFKNKLLIGKIAGNLNITKDKFLKFISDCCSEYYLFVCDDDKFWSSSLHRRMGEFEVIRQKRRESGRVGGRNRANNQGQNPVPHLKSASNNTSNARDKLSDASISSSDASNSEANAYKNQARELGIEKEKINKKENSVASPPHRGGKLSPEELANRATPEQIREIMAKTN